jgi:hypothetical protein
MKTNEFREITIQRFYFLTDDFPDTSINLKKERNENNKILDLTLKNYLTFSVFKEIIETIEIIGEQTFSTPQILFINHGTETYLYYQQNIVPYINLRVKFICEE